MRFVVRTVTGYTATAGGNSEQRTSYMVLDSAYNYREVRSFYAEGTRRADLARLTLANEAAAQLEAEYGSV